MKDELFDVSGKICIVTGGLGQIGKNMARELYERDARVAVFAAHPTPERIEKTFPDHDPGRLKFYKVDINQKNTIEAALDEMQQTWGDAPDVLVNCAGIGSGVLHNMISTRHVNLIARRGEYYLLDKSEFGHVYFVLLRAKVPKFAENSYLRLRRRYSRPAKCK